MSINAISGISMYEYYYKINKDKEEEKKKSPLADKMREYGLVPTDNEVQNIAMLKKARELKEAQNKQVEDEIPYSERPWADLMYQLNISFNPDPKDDISDIKKELVLLTKGMDDEELNKEIKDLEDSVERMYISFQNNYLTTLSNSTTLTDELKNLSMINRANLL